MKIYIATVVDRHTNPFAEIFTDLEKAKMWARDKAEKYSYYKEDIDETETVDGWEFYIKYTCEGDYIFIVEQEVPVVICKHFELPDFCNRIGEFI